MMLGHTRQWEHTLACLLAPPEFGFDVLLIGSAGDSRISPGSNEGHEPIVNTKTHKICYISLFCVHLGSEALQKYK